LARRLKMAHQQSTSTDPKPPILLAQPGGRCVSDGNADLDRFPIVDWTNNGLSC